MHPLSTVVIKIKYKLVSVSIMYTHTKFGFYLNFVSEYLNFYFGKNSILK